MTARFHAPPSWPPTPPGWTPPSGWRPDASWPPAPDGWVFWVDENGAPAGPPGQLAPPPAPLVSPPAERGERRGPGRWLIPTGVGVLAFLLGVGAGAAGGGAPATAEPSVVETPGPTVTVTATVDPTQARQDELDQQAADLEAQAAALDQRASDLDAREAAVSGAEKAWEDNTIPGDGTYRVGVDIAPGTYVSSGNSWCYWERLSDLDGTFNSIIANDNIAGQGVVTIKSSDAAFSNSGCADWHLQP